MIKPPRVLLVYGYEPSGHSAAAFSLGEALAEQGASVSYVEVAGRHHPKAGQAVARAYHALLRTAPKAFGALYASPAARRALKAVRAAYLASGGARKLLAGVRREAPDVVVCPQASVSAVFAGARARRELDVPVVGVLTDRAVHPFWTEPPPDLLLAPDEDAAALLRARGGRALACGIPVGAAFARPPARADARAALALPASAPVVLFSGGSKGMAGLEAAAQALLAASPRSIALALCGANDRLLARLSRRTDLRLRAFGPQPPAMVAALLAAADLHVAKPGGVSTAESLAAGIPLVLLPPLPGQEVGNAAWLSAQGAAEGAATAREAGQRAALLLEDGRRLAAMTAAAWRAGRPDAAARAAERILAPLLTKVSDPLLTNE